jgi:hypothetical protein
LQLALPSWILTCLSIVFAPKPLVGNPDTVIFLVSAVAHELPESQVLQAEAVVLLNVWLHRGEATQIMSRRLYIAFNRFIALIFLALLHLLFFNIYHLLTSLKVMDLILFI